MGIRPFSAGDRLGVLIVLVLAIAAMLVTLIPVSEPEQTEVKPEPFYKTVQAMHPADTSLSARQTGHGRHTGEKRKSKSRKQRKKDSQSKPAKNTPAPRDPLSDEIPTTR